MPHLATIFTLGRKNQGRIVAQSPGDLRLRAPGGNDDEGEAERMEGK